MVKPRQQAGQQGGGGIILGGGDGGSIVMGDELRELDVPSQALNGALSGSIMGAGIGAGISALMTVSKDLSEGGQHVLQSGEYGIGHALKNALGKHLGVVLGCTTVLAGVGAYTRYASAKKHNEWSERHYRFLEGQQQQAFAEREAAKRENVSEQIQR